MSFGERFLHYPDLFPARPAGEPWGEQTLSLNIAGPACFKGLNANQLEAARNRFGDSDSEIAADQPPVNVNVMQMEEEEYILFDRTGWEQSLDLDFLPDKVRIAAYNFIGLIQLQPKLEATLWTCDAGDEEFPSIFENFYRVLVAYQALERGGILLHSAGILLDGKAQICYGHSGAGKSTLTRLAVQSGHEILSDDLNLIVDLDEPQVRRIPFAGDFGRVPVGAEIHPLGGVFRLKQGENNREQLSPAVAFSSLIASSPFVNRDPYRYERVAEITEKLLSKFSPSQLTFSKQGGCWDLFSSNP